MEMSSWNYIHELSDKVDNFKQLLTGVVPRTDFRGEYWLSGTYNNSDSGFKDACERVVAREFVNSDVGVNWITSNSAFERLAERQSAQRPKGIEFLGVFTEKSLLAFLLSFWHGGWSTSTRLAVGPDPGRPSEFQVFASGEDENPPSGCVFVNVQD
ncbi:MAG: hypothetical protein LBB14_02150 [Puniceicoccales bacterium]|nr:hypothetical protein [Puniceicoccales bacterium]